MKTILALILILTSPAFAADSQQSTKKKYPGAQDEQELKVQEELPDPQQKFDQKTQELKIRNNLFKNDSKPAKASR